MKSFKRNQNYKTQLQIIISIFQLTIISKLKYNLTFVGGNTIIFARLTIQMAFTDIPVYLLDNLK